MHEYLQVITRGKLSNHFDGKLYRSYTLKIYLYKDFIIQPRISNQYIYIFVFETQLYFVQRIK